MAWIISKALMEDYVNSHCSREQAEESSGANCLDGEQFAPSKSNPTPQAYCAPDKMTAFSRLSRFGMTFAPLTGSRGEDVLTWFLEGSPVKTFQRQAKGLESRMEKEAGCGESLQESFAKYDRDTCSWRIPHCLFQGDWGLFSETWPRWGTMRNGECWELTVVVPLLNASGFGLPAPTKTMGKRGWGLSNQKARYSEELETNARLFGYKPHPSVLEWSMGWIPTWSRLVPLAMDKYQQWLQQHSDF